MKKIRYLIVFVLIILINSPSYSQANSPKITFLEIGSVTCIPCKKMQPIMKSIEEKFGDQVKIIFYDIKKPENKKYVTKYGISLIPTQIFLDENYNEIHRHVGFYPEKDIEEFLKSKGLKPRKKEVND